MDARLTLSAVEIAATVWTIVAATDPLVPLPSRAGWRATSLGGAGGRESGQRRDRPGRLPCRDGFRSRRCGGGAI
jgi:hypothetical protein